MKLWAHKLFFFGSLLIALSFLAPTAHAQCDPNQPYNEVTLECHGQAQDEARTGEMNNEAYIHTVQQNIQASLTCEISGMGCTADPSQQSGYVQKSLIGYISNGISATYLNPPASTYAFIHDAGQTLGFIPKSANAQGIGFTGLSSLLPIWKAFRNIAYAGLAIVMVVVGFMVMMRQHIDPKTVVTVQNAIPKIITSLILITFSYAIVGILIDIMYLIILLLVGIFKSSGLLPSPGLIAQTVLGSPSPEALYAQGGIWTNIANLFGVGAVAGDIPLVGQLSLTSPYRLAMTIFGWNDAFVIGGLIAALYVGIGAALPPVGLAIGAVAGLPIIASLLISLALLFLIIRLAIFFIGAYIQIIMGLIFAPIQLLFEALPGNNAFDNWIRNLIANLIVFPIGAIVFMLSAIFINFTNTNTGTLWAPPFGSLFTHGNQIGALLSIGVLFALTDIAGQVQQALKPKPFMNAGAEGIVGTLTQPLGLVMTGVNMATSLSTAAALRSKNPLPKDPSSGGGGAGHKSSGHNT